MFDESGTVLLNGVRMSWERGFGFCQNSMLSTSPAYCLDDHHIFYAVGSQIVMYDSLTETQKLVDGFDGDEELMGFVYYRSALFEDEVVYVLQSRVRGSSLVLTNYSKATRQKVSLFNLERDEMVTQITLLNDHKQAAIASLIHDNTRLTIV
jgi:hypothetical protein